MKRIFLILFYISLYSSIFSQANGLIKLEQIDNTEELVFKTDTTTKIATKYDINVATFGMLHKVSITTNLVAGDNIITHNLGLLDDFVLFEIRTSDGEYVSCRLLSTTSNTITIRTVSNIVNVVIKIIG
jgi:hypothetical protein